MPDSEPAPETPEELAGPRYALGEQFSKGGMGGLWYARESATGRTIALKRILGRPDAESFRRFLNEARITARLEHPNIVPVHGLGTDPDGQPFYTMKLVQGTDLAGVLKQLAKGDPETVARYPLAQLLIIFQKVCDAVAFAHSHHVIHRDLKPANLMLGPFGEVLVMDWGLAKDLGEPQASPASDAPSNPDPSSADAGATLPGQAFGSPHYMAPEQARGDIHLHDPRTDIYALGAVLYQILALRRPVSGTTAGAILARVIDGDLDPLMLPRLEAAPDEDADLPPELRRPKLPRLELRHLPESVIPESLAAVVLRAMAFDPEKRYQTVPELQREITAYQNGFATGAERAGLGKQIMLALRRNRREATVAGIALLLLFILAVASFLRIRSERDLADGQRVKAESEKTRADQERTAAEESRATTQRQIWKTSRTSQAAAEDYFRAGKWRLGVAYLAHALRNDPGNVQAAMRLWSALVYGQGDRSDDLPTIVIDTGTPLVTAEWNKDETRIATGGKEGRIWDTASRASVGPSYEVPGFEKLGCMVKRIAFSPDGQRVLMDAVTEARLFDVSTGVPIGHEIYGHRTGFSAIAFSPNGERIFETDIANSRIWNGETAELLDELGSSGEVAAFDMNSGYMAIADSDIAICDLKTGRVLYSIAASHADQTYHHIAYSPSGEVIMTIEDNSTIQLWDARARRPLGGAITHDGNVTSTQFAPDSKTLAIAQDDGTARIWDVATGKAIGAPLRHNARITHVAFSPDGKKVVTASADKTARLWNSTSGIPLSLSLQHQDKVTSAVFSQDGRSVLTASLDGTACVWRPAVGDKSQTSAPSPEVSDNGSFRRIRSKDGKREISNERGFFCLYDRENGKQLTELYSIRPNAAFSDDCRTLITLTDYGQLQLWDATAGKALGEPFPSRGSEDEIEDRDKIEHFAIAADGQRILAAMGDGKLVAWELATARKIGTLLDCGAKLFTLIMPRDRNEVITIGTDGSVGVWSALNGYPIRRPDRKLSVTTLAVSDDQRLIAIRDREENVQVWDIETNRPVSDVFETSAPPFARLGWPKEGEPWIDDLVAAASGLRFDDSGGIQDVPNQERVALRRELRALVSENSGSFIKDSEWARLLRWWLTDSSEREARP